MKNIFFALFALLTLSTSTFAMPVVFSGGSYVENFDALRSGLPSGWSLSSNATSTGLGNQTGTFNSATVSWGDSGGAFKNVASASAGFTASTSQQAARIDRALGLRQTGSFADPGAAFNFNFSTLGTTVSSLSIDLMMLSVQGRSTTFSIQYGVGSAPSSFATIGSYLDPGSFGSTTFSFTSADFGTALNDQANVWFRVVALTAATGSFSRDTVAIDNFMLTGSAITTVPEAFSTLGGLLSVFGVLALSRRIVFARSPLGRERLR